MEKVRRRGEVKEGAGWEETRLEQDPAAAVYVPVVAKKYPTSREYHATG